MFIERDLSKIKLVFAQLMSPQSLNVSPFPTLMSLYDCRCVPEFPGVEWKKISYPRLALVSPISVAAMVVVLCHPWSTGLN